MRVYLSRGVKSRLRRLGAQSPLDAALLDPDLGRHVGRVRLSLEPKVVSGVEVSAWRRGLERLSTGCRMLDRLLGGGLEVGYVYELAGEFGAGKTQLCHQLAVMVQLPQERGGLSGRALYIDTEGTFRPERVISMARYRGLDPEEALDGIEFVEARSEGALLAAVLAARSSSARLIVVDTLVAPLEVGEGVEALARRQRAVSRLLSMLREAASGGRVVVVANRMSADRPAGGLAMALGCQYSLLMRKLGGSRRLVELVRAPHLPPGSTAVVLAEEGVLDA